MKLLVLSDLHAEHSPFVPDPEAVAACDAAHAFASQRVQTHVDARHARSAQIISMRGELCGIG